jgi:hypothetical protein
MVPSPSYATDGTLFLGTAIGPYTSSDRGATWHSLVDGLQNLVVQTLAISPGYAHDQTLFAGTHRGVFRSTNGGQLWSPASAGLPTSSLLDVSDNPFDIETLPSVVTDQAGGVHVVWMQTHESASSPDGVATDLMYTKRRQDGTFEEPVAITVPERVYSKEYSVAVDLQGVVHIAFLRMDDQLETFGDLYYVNNRSGTFASPQMVYGGNPWNWAERPSIAVDRDGVAHMVFYSNGDVLQYMTNRSGAFVASSSIPHGDAPHQIDTAVDGNGAAHVVYFAFSEGSYAEYSLYYTTNATGEFAPPVAIASDPLILRPPVLAADDAGTVHLVYENGQRFVIYMENRTGTFTKMTLPGWGDYPSLVVDGSGVAHVVFNQVSENFYTSNAGGAFHAPVQINQWMQSAGGGARGFGRWIARSPDGRIHVVFQAKANTLYSELDHDIFYATFPGSVVHNNRREPRRHLPRPGDAPRLHVQRPPR